MLTATCTASGKRKNKEYATHFSVACKKILSNCHSERSEESLATDTFCLRFFPLFRMTKNIKRK